MNAPELLGQLRWPAAGGLTLNLQTLTPLYTGGIGQLGDQIHSSNLLGGLRQMSCLVARTLGDGDFEATVWGNAGGGGHKAAAKQVALRWDTRGLEKKTLPAEISLSRDGGKKSRWWFNTGFEGKLSLQMTRNGISDSRWQILLIALAIQLRHSSFGAKDQFGLGVLTPVDDKPFSPALDGAAPWPKAVLDESSGRLNLLRYAFGRVRFAPRAGQRPGLNRSTALTLALATRATLRNALRAKEDAPDMEKTRLTELRHRMLGKLNQFGSAVNVSAAFGAVENPELRIAVALRPGDKDARAEVFKAFRGCLDNVEGLIDGTGYRLDSSVWEFGGAHANDKVAWLNSLAGVTA
jgi:hypothetical protein